MTDAPAARARPFYTEYAWAFDLIIDRPVRKECAVIASWLIERGVLPGARLLEAMRLTQPRGDGFGRNWPQTDLLATRNRGGQQRFGLLRRQHHQRSRGRLLQRLEQAVLSL